MGRGLGANPESNWDAENLVFVCLLVFSLFVHVFTVLGVLGVSYGVILSACVPQSVFENTRAQARKHAYL